MLRNVIIVPESTAWKQQGEDGRRELTERYAALCRHYGMQGVRNNAGLGHENGSVESAHGHLKRRIRQALILRGSNDLDCGVAHFVCMC